MEDIHRVIDFGRDPNGQGSTLPGEPSSAEPLVCLLYEDEADRQQMLSRIRKAGLGELPRVMISVESRPAKPAPLTASARRRRPAKVA